jgi:hypothetical protein
VKWSDDICESREAWSNLLTFAATHGLRTVYMTSRTVAKTFSKGDVRCVVVPLPMLCFEIGRLAANQELVGDRYGLPAELE